MANKQGRSCAPQIRWCRVFVGVVFLTLLTTLSAQSFKITDISFDPQNRIHFKHEADASSYYILYRGDDVTATTKM